jgi:acyl-CoA dehydrogenase
LLITPDQPCHHVNSFTKEPFAALQKSDCLPLVSYSYKPAATMSATPIVPFSEPPYLAGLPSPYYKPTHLAWQKACREFIQKNLIENALEWDTLETVPEHVFNTFAKAGMLLPSLPAPLPVAWLKRLGINELLGVVKVEDFDYIHNMIYTDEV